jgi:hypothetical protein
MLVTKCDRLHVLKKINREKEWSNRQTVKSISSVICPCFLHFDFTYYMSHIRLLALWPQISGDALVAGSNVVNDEGFGLSPMAYVQVLYCCI